MDSAIVGWLIRYASLVMHSMTRVELLKGCVLQVLSLGIDPTSTVCRRYVHQGLATSGSSFKLSQCSKTATLGSAKIISLSAMIARAVFIALTDFSFAFLCSNPSHDGSDEITTQHRGEIGYKMRTFGSVKPGSGSLKIRCIRLGSLSIVV